VKVGHTPAGGQLCQRRDTPQSKQEGYPEQMRQQALRRYVDKMNLQPITRHLGVVHQAVANWMNPRHIRKR
jgi:hypothetical protein